MNPVQTVIEAEADTNSQPDDSGQNTQAIHSRLEKDSRFHSVIEKFITRFNSQLQLMHASLNKADFAELADLAHWLKGAGGTVGFDELTEPAELLEQQAKSADVDGSRQTLASLDGFASRLVSPGSIVDDKEAVMTTGASIASVVQSQSVSTETAPVVSRLATDSRFHSVIQKFVVRLNEQLEEMQQAAHSSNFPVLADLAHWLKGAGGTVGFDEFTEPAEQLEQMAKSDDHAGSQQQILVLNQIASRIVLPDDNKKIQKQKEMPKN